MPARTLTIRGVPDSVLRSLRSQAQASRRSLNAELLVVLERAAAEGQTSGVPAVREARPAPYGTPSAKAPSFPAGVDRRALAEVCRRHHIQRLALFGSRATGAARLDSAHPPGYYLVDRARFRRKPRPRTPSRITTRHPATVRPRS